MDEMYTPTPRSRKWVGLIPLAALIILVGGGIYLFFTSRQKLVSPVPSTPSFEVIFFTPTPLPVTPTSTPSATPRAVRKAPTVTSKPKPTATPGSPTTTGKPSPTSTGKPSPTPTRTPSPTP